MCVCVCLCVCVCVCVCMCVYTHTHTHAHKLEYCVCIFGLGVYLGSLYWSQLWKSRGLRPRKWNICQPLFLRLRLTFVSLLYFFRLRQGCFLALRTLVRHIEAVPVGSWLSDLRDEFHAALVVKEVLVVYGEGCAICFPQ